MFIKASKNNLPTIELICDLSHENLVKFIDSLHDLNFVVELSDENIFKETFNKEEEIAINHSMWADEDTWLDVLEIIDKINNDL